MTGLMNSARSFGELMQQMKNTRQHIRVTAGFVIQGRKPAEIDEVIEVSRSFATELISGGKAVACEPPKPVVVAPKPADPKPKT